MITEKQILSRSFLASNTALPSAPPRNTPVKKGFFKEMVGIQTKLEEQLSSVPFDGIRIEDSKLTFTQEGLTALFGPGLYEIHCVVTGKSYFGESESLGQRLAKHFQLCGSSWVDGTPPELWQDWLTFGQESFRIQIICFGPEYRFLSQRTMTESILARYYAARAYNKPPGRKLVTHVMFYIRDIPFPSYAIAEALTGEPRAEIKAKIEDKTNTDYRRAMKDPIERNRDRRQKLKNGSFEVDFDRAQEFFSEELGRPKRSIKFGQFANEELPGRFRVNADLKRAHAGRTDSQEDKKIPLFDLESLQAADQQRRGPPAAGGTRANRIAERGAPRPNARTTMNQNQDENPDVTS